MSKITFRADDELITQLEEYDASKSEVMREALREYLNGSTESKDSFTPDSGAEEGTLDEMIVERVDAAIAERLDQQLPRRQPQDVNVNISLAGDSDGETAAVNEQSDASHTSSTGASHTPEERMTEDDAGENTDANETKTCAQCGESLSQSHVYCPNCGEKSSRRVFCECGDELRSDWGFCPGCGRRTAAADVLDKQ